MRYCTFQYGTRVGAGLIHGRLVVDLGQAFQRAFKRPAKFPDLGAFLAQGGYPKSKTLDLATIKEDRVVAIPGAQNLEQLSDNLKVLDVTLTRFI